MFFDDALLASRELEITLTGRDCGLEDRAPMCGVPYHAAENYISKLIDKGYKVAICEQVEDPKQAKGIVKRDVIRVITPGTVIDSEKIEKSKNNYIACAFRKESDIGLAFVDVTTGEFRCTELINSMGTSKLYDEFAKYCPSEIILSKELFDEKTIVDTLKQRFSSYISLYQEWNFHKETAYKSLINHFSISSLDGFGLKDYTVGINASGALIQYLRENQKVELGHITKLVPYGTSEYMMLDISTRRNLELTETMREKTKKGSLLWVLDKTKTAMGGRLLRKWIEQPLISETEINRRLDAVEELKDNLIARDEIVEILNNVYDIERLLSKIVYNTANARDLNALKGSVQHLPSLKKYLSAFRSSYLNYVNKNIDTLDDICKLIDNAISDEPPFSIKEGDIIKTGFDDDIDKLRAAKTDGKQWIANLENEEKEKTGIKNLKIRYNNVFGYYIEITNSNLLNAPEHYTRKQTLSNAERFTIPELKEIENIILGAEEKVVKLEYEVFTKVREQILREVRRLQSTAELIAEIDVLQSLATVADTQRYSKPSISNKAGIAINKGRHPVIEKIINTGEFIDNDTLLDTNENMLAIITGPNMAGKSTYMRQVALITLMAQIGSFIPAGSADIGIVDRIYTRVGASDDLASGQSTFMVEMAEVSNILNNATSKSLLILDEIGRGTSTFDGLSIAWSVVEYISHNIGAKTLFATHYHELTELEGRLDGVKNYRIAIKENGDDIIFLRKIVRGGTDNSYGIQVAKLAGLPSDVITRAKEILQELSKKEIEEFDELTQNNLPLRGGCHEVTAGVDNEALTECHCEERSNLCFTQNTQQSASDSQMTLFVNEQEGVINELRKLDIMNMTPMDAMQKLWEIKGMIK